MVFANLGPQEKDAFFSLLDEYFASRPEILTKGSNNSSHGQTAVAVAASSAAASTVRNAMVKHPEAAAKYMTAGLKQFAASNSNHSNDNRTPGGGSSNKGTVTGSGPGESAEEPTMAGRIAAAQAMFSGKQNPFSKHSASKEPSPSPPPPPSYGGPSSSLKSSTFAPPPVRRTPSSTPNPRFPPPPASPPPVNEEQGEWVEALYDYDSGEAGDLKVTEGQRILLVDRTSDDWWTGEVNGNKGLIPASYVKAL